MRLWYAGFPSVAVSPRAMVPPLRLVHDVSAVVTRRLGHPPPRLCSGYAQTNQAAPPLPSPWSVDGDAVAENSYSTREGSRRTHIRTPTFPTV